MFGRSLNLFGFKEKVLNMKNTSLDKRAFNFDFEIRVLLIIVYEVIVMRLLHELKSSILNKTNSEILEDRTMYNI